MRVVIDGKRCNGCEACVNACPDVFRLWGEHLKPRIEVPDPEHNRGAVEAAAASCPRKAINIQE